MADIFTYKMLRHLSRSLCKHVHPQQPAVLATHSLKQLTSSPLMSMRTIQMKTLSQMHINPMVSMLANQQQMMFSSRARDMFRTPTPAQS